MAMNEVLNVSWVEYLERVFDESEIGLLREWFRSVFLGERAAEKILFIKTGDLPECVPVLEALHNLAGDDFMEWSVGRTFRHEGFFKWAPEKKVVALHVQNDTQAIDVKWAASDDVHLIDDEEAGKVHQVLFTGGVVCVGRDQPGCWCLDYGLKARLVEIRPRYVVEFVGCLFDFQDDEVKAWAGI